MSGERAGEDVTCEFGTYAENGDMAIAIWTCGEPAQSYEMADGGTATVCDRHRSWLPALGATDGEKDGRMPDSTADHEHVLLSCPDCGGERTPDCIGCGGRGYVEVCAICREPMGNRRRKWKREDTDA